MAIGGGALVDRAVQRQVLAGPTTVRDLFVEGRQIVRDGHVATFDLGKAVARQNALARRLSGET